MKKTLLIAISLVAVFFFAGTTEVTAQWCADVEWADGSCSCGTITSKILDWEIRYVIGNALVYSGNVDITNETSPYHLEGNDLIRTDTGYKLIVKISYYDSSIDPLCCTGTGFDTADGQGLIDCDPYITITMN
ncbi:MAG: hypothetical protein HQ521_06505 [Bacteroidetes bacterium]|nr:hypothetical protein [Bacteroidota bacterium]